MDKTSSSITRESIFCGSLEPSPHIQEYRCSKQSFRLPSLDGWRALSIVLVLGAHCQRTSGFPNALSPVFGRIFDGDLGVRFFFVISGFLITWLLISEQRRTGKVHLKYFYARRALRILPVYLAFVFTLLVLQMCTDYKQNSLAWFGNLTFTTNFIKTPWPSGHLWSLSVEEQFYLIWPGLFALCGKNIWRVLGVLCIPLLLAPVCRVITFKQFYPDNLIFAHFSFFNYFDSLAIGCLSAVMLATIGESLKAYFESAPILMAGAGIFLIAAPYVLNDLPLPGRILAAFDSSLQACGLSILLLQSINYPNMGFYRVLNWSWVRNLGVLSYSLYIWQQLFCAPPTIFGWKNAWWMSFPVWLLSVLAVASISYYGFERPLLTLRACFRRT